MGLLFEPHQTPFEFRRFERSHKSFDQNGIEYHVMWIPPNSMRSVFAQGSLRLQGAYYLFQQALHRLIVVFPSIIESFESTAFLCGFNHYTINNGVTCIDNLERSVAVR